MCHDNNNIIVYKLLLFTCSLTQALCPGQMLLEWHVKNTIYYRASGLKDKPIKFNIFFFRIFENRS